MLLLNQILMTAEKQVASQAVKKFEYELRTHIIPETGEDLNQLERQQYH